MNFSLGFFFFLQTDQNNLFIEIFEISASFTFNFFYRIYRMVGKKETIQY